MREYEIYVPLRYNDGRPIEPERLKELKQRLVDEFGGLTHFPQENEGLWKVGRHTFRDQIVIFRVIADDGERAGKFFAELKQQLIRDLNQEDVLVIQREITRL